MPFNPKSLQNLKVISSSDKAREMQKNSVAKRMENQERRDALKQLAGDYAKVMKDLPELSPVDVLHMLMIQALQEEQFEDASRYANMLAPYKAPKLAQIEQKITDTVSTMSDEELRAYIASQVKPEEAKDGNE